MDKNIEISYVMVKPRFANNLDLINEIKKRIKEKKLKIIDNHYLKYDRDLAQKHYA